MINWTGTRWLDQLIFASFIVLVAFVLSTILRKMINRALTRETKYLKVDATKYSFIKNAISFIIYTIAVIFIFYSIPKLRNIGATLFAGAGILAAILAFASQQAFSNIIGGIFIVMFKPFRVGDWVRVGKDYLGVVEDINLRHTTIRDFENKRIIIPNSVISSETIVNSHVGDERIRKHIEFPVSYDSDINLAKKIMEEEAQKHPLLLDERTRAEKKKGVSPTEVRVIGFGDSSVNIRLYAWAKNPDDAWILKTDLFQLIKERFDKEGIEIPYPYRTVVMKENKAKN